MLDGFYVGYATAAPGAYGIMLFVLKRGTIVGVDGGGVKFDGNMGLNEETGCYDGEITVDAPPNVGLIQGATSGPSGLSYKTSFSLPANFLDLPFINIHTPLGNVNIKLEKLRDLGSGLID